MLFTSWICSSCDRHARQLLNVLVQERVKKHQSGSSSQPGGERNCHQDMQKKEESKRDGWIRTLKNVETVR